MYFRQSLVFLFIVIFNTLASTSPSPEASTTSTTVSQPQLVAETDAQQWRQSKQVYRNQHLQKPNEVSYSDVFMDHWYEDCSNGKFFTCMKQKALTYVDRLLHKKSMDVTDGISLENTVLPQRDELGRNVWPDEGGDLDSKLWDRTEKLLSSYVLRVQLPDLNRVADGARKLGLDLDSILGDSKDIEEARRGGKKKMLGVLLAGFAMMKGMMMAIGMGAIALLAKKALILGALALLLSAIIGLKKLASSKGNEEYVVTIPHHSSQHSYGGGGGGGGYGGGSSYHRRSFKDPNFDPHRLAYKAHTYASEVEKQE